MNNAFAHKRSKDRNVRFSDFACHTTSRLRHIRTILGNFGEFLTILGGTNRLKKTVLSKNKAENCTPKNPFQNNFSSEIFSLTLPSTIPPTHFGKVDPGIRQSAVHTYYRVSLFPEQIGSVIPGQEGQQPKGKIVSAFFHTFWHFSTHFHTFSEFFQNFSSRVFLRIKRFFYCFGSKR